MDIEYFINLVNVHKCLWDQSDSSYHKREYQRRAWQEISVELDICIDELKKKWRGLRDTFGKELKKVSCEKSGQVEPISKWPYFKLLLFLQESMSRRDGKTCVTHETFDGNNTYDWEDTSVGSNYAPSPSPGRSSEQNKQTSKKVFTSPLKRYLLPDESNKKLSNTEKEKSKRLQKYFNDPDAQFLLSLLPFMKDIPKNRMLMVRTKILQVLMDEQNDSTPP